MKFPFGSRIGLALLTAVAACSTAPKRSHSLLPGDMEFKRAFLAYYPDLSAEQRDQLIGSPDTWRMNLTQWGILNRFYSQPNPREPLEYSGDTDNHTLRDLRIELADTSSEPELKATLVYRDGRSVDATRDVKWTVYPKLGWVEISEHSTPRLVSGCIDTELEISADFYGERQGTLLLPVKKPIVRLEIQGVESTENAVKLVAWCENGETTDVSCQADWEIQSAEYEVHGCGQLRRLHAIPAESEPVNAVIRAAYGSHETAKTLRLR
jgi:hypothetical protein